MVTSTLVALVLLAACTPSPAVRTPTATLADPVLAPYIRQTDSNNQSLEASIPSATPDTPQPTPTPTPIIYTVVEGDTFSSIAYRHQIKLSELISANPDIDPNFLTVGISVSIPITGSLPVSLMEPTPIPLDLGSPVCYPYQSTGLFCLVLVTNAQSIDVENIAADITIISRDSQYSTTLPAKSLLNVLKSGRSIALSAYFSGPVPTEFLASASLTSVLPVPSDDGRYLALELPQPMVEISRDGHNAWISGKLSSPPENPTVQRLWLVAVAYDKNHQPVGMRKWISGTQLPAGGQIPFQITIYSLGAGIAEVEISYEATP